MRREVKQLGHFLLVALAVHEQWLRLLGVDGVGFSLLRVVRRRRQCRPLARRERDQLGDAVDKGVGHVKHTAAVAHRRLGCHGAKGGDLADTFLAVLLAHVVDHAIATILAEIDVEVRHRYPFRVQEALEQQVVLEGVKIGNSQAVRHQRART